jgi:hypothetical protein
MNLHQNGVNLNVADDTTWCGDARACYTGAKGPAQRKINLEVEDDDYMPARNNRHKCQRWEWPPFSHEE